MHPQPFRDLKVHRRFLRDMAAMRNGSTLYVGLDIHNDLIAVAYASDDGTAAPVALGTIEKYWSFGFCGTCRQAMEDCRHSINVPNFDSRLF